MSVARFVIYYYRFTSADKTYDIGLVVSIVEPSVGIIAACAPAMKLLFKFLAPRLFTTDDSYPQQTSPIKSQPRQSLSYHFGMNKEMDGERLEGFERDEEMYGMRPLRSVDSREHFAALSGDGPRRTRSTKTGSSVAVEAVPKHVLNNPE